MGILQLLRHPASERLRSERSPEDPIRLASTVTVEHAIAFVTCCGRGFEHRSHGGMHGAGFENERGGFKASAVTKKGRGGQINAEDYLSMAGNDVRSEAGWLK